jgi:hypothetical protein
MENSHRKTNPLRARRSGHSSFLVFGQKMIGLSARLRKVRLRLALGCVAADCILNYINCNRSVKFAAKIRLASDLDRPTEGVSLGPGAPGR